MSLSVLLLISNHFGIFPVHLSNQQLLITMLERTGTKKKPTHIFVCVKYFPSWEDNWLKKKKNNTENIIDCQFPTGW